MGSGYRWQTLGALPDSKVGFVLIPPERSGVRFSNTLSEALISTNRILELGSGVGMTNAAGFGGSNTALVVELP